MKHLFDFNGLQIPRYHVTLCHNESGDEWQLAEGSNEDSMFLNYQDVIAFRRIEIVGPDEYVPMAPTSVQVFRNNLSTLNSFLAFHGKSTDGNVGNEMLSNFDLKLRDYLSSLTVSIHARHDRTSHLRAWHRAVAALLASAKNAKSKTTHDSRISPFHAELRAAVASTGESVKSMAERTGTSSSAILRWLKGAYPQRKALPSLARLERHLGMERDSLRSLIPQPAKETNRARAQAAKRVIPYREQLRANTCDTYIVPVNCLSKQFLGEWNEFFEHKTSTQAPLKRAKRLWRLLPKDKIGLDLPTICYRFGRGCATASLVLKRVCSFFGYLSRPTSKGGYGLGRENAESLAWFSVPEAVKGYLEFMQTRSDGAIHGGHAGFAALVASLTNERTGYLPQCPQLAARLPQSFADFDWDASCAKCHEISKQWKQAATDISRNPEDPIRGLLNLSEPLLPIFRAVDKLDEKAAAAVPGSKAEATLKRDALLLSMLVANPLRARNFMSMTWRSDQTGNLYRREDGQWRLRFVPSDFKNKSATANQQYDAPLPRSLGERIQEYLDEFRPVLVEAATATDFVFPNKTGKKWTTLNRQVLRITGAFIPEAHPFGPHAIRHIVATDYLRKHPNDFPTVAQLLNDKLETVLRVYAHLRQDDSFGRYEEHLNAVRSSH
jgi:integrase/transcriptional regulator with XRE-family HTH domain